MSARLETRLALLAATLVLAAVALSAQAAPGAAAAEQLAPRAEVQRWLDLRTVPLVVGATFELDGQLYTTGFDGAVSIPTTGLTQMSSRLHFVGVPTDDPTLQAMFLRFSLPPQVGYRRPAIAVFDVGAAVQFRFADPTGAAVPVDRISGMRIRSSTGEERTLSPTELAAPVMLPAQEATPTPAGLASRDLRYTVQDVMVDGTSTVNRSQQDFFPARDSEVQVDTLFFTVHVQVDDALFGSTTGRQVVLRRPDGTETRYRLVDGKATFGSLPRGDYKVRVDGSGWTNWQPISVTRDQSVQMRQLTTLDLATLGTGVVVVVLGLVLLGRGHRRRRARRRLPQGPREPSGRDLAAIEPDKPEVSVPEPVP